MDWLKNNVVAGILVLLVVVCLISSVSLASKVRQKDKSLQDEMARRLQTEEQQQGVLNEKAALEKSVSELSKSLEQETALYEATKKELTQEQLVVKALKEELEKTVKLKDKLEEDLKQALKSH